MAARRANTKADTDIAAQLPVWQLAYASISDLSKLPDVSDSITTANRYIEKFRKEYSVPDQTAAELKATKNELKQTVAEIRASSQKEIEASSKVLIQIANIITSRETALTSLANERPKRGRESSAAPSQTGASITAAGTSAATSAANGGLTPLLPARAASAALSLHILERTKKQLPLQTGRKVAFRVPSDKAGNGKVTAAPPGVENVAYEEGAWILATIKSKDEKTGRYVVQDVEGEDGQAPPVYTATLRTLIPLPIFDVAPSDPSHLSQYPEYRSGSTVLALFPDTTSFYKAEVVATPKEIRADGQRTAPLAAKSAPSYRVKFEDDQGEIRLVSAEEVIDFPGY